MIRLLLLLLLVVVVAWLMSTMSTMLLMLLMSTMNPTMNGTVAELQTKTETQSVTCTSWMDWILSHAQCTSLREGNGVCLHA